MITAVVPTIPGREDLLARALAGVHAQTYPATHIIVELDQHREGAAATRNRALKQVTTEWVAFCDDDDVWYPNHLKLCARAARQSCADVVYPGYDCDQDPVDCLGMPFDPVLLRQRNYVPVTVFARTQLVLDAGGFQEHPDEHGDPCEDWGLWLALLDRGATFYHLPVKTWRWNYSKHTTRGRPDRW